MLTYIKAGTVKRIHVDRHVVAQNRKHGENKPAITVQTSRGPLKARKVEVLGYSTFEQSDGQHVKPLSCGARLWVKTHAAIEVIR